jgi:hypothetical protein
LIRLGSSSVGATSEPFENAAKNAHGTILCVCDTDTAWNQVTIDVGITPFFNQNFAYVKIKMNSIQLPPMETLYCYLINKTLCFLLADCTLFEAKNVSSKSCLSEVSEAIDLLYQQSVI